MTDLEGIRQTTPYRYMSGNRQCPKCIQPVQRIRAIRVGPVTHHRCSYCGRTWYAGNDPDIPYRDLEAWID